MIKNTILIIFAATALTSPLKAMDAIDTFVNNHCENRCNGPSTDCWNCYSQGMDLWQNPFTNPETDTNSDSDDDDPYGNVGFRFA